MLFIKQFFAKNLQKYIPTILIKNLITGNTQE